MFKVLRQRDFGLLWLAGLISMTGDWVLSIALPIYVYTLTHSALATSATAAAELLPGLLLGSVAGVYVDRWPRKLIMVCANVLLGVTLLPLVFVRSAEFVWIVYPIAFIQATIAQFFNPAEAAVLPTLVDEEYLVTANSLSSLTSNMARLVGPALGGLIAVTVGVVGVTVVDSVSFLIAAVLVALISIPNQTPAAPTTSDDVVPSAVWHQWIDGLRVVWGRRGLAVLIGLFALMQLGEGVMGTMFVIWVKQVIGGSALQLGWFMTAQAVGGILGGLVIGTIGSRTDPYRLAVVCFPCFALLDMVLFGYPLAFSGIWLGLAVIALVGIPAAGLGSGFMTLLQMAAPDRYRGRVFGMLGTSASLTRLVGTAIAGTFGGIFGPIALLVLFQGGGYLLAGLLLISASRWIMVHGDSSAGLPLRAEA